MRISDWSSDVCSSDLQARLNAVHGLFEVMPGTIWQVRGYDLSVMTIIRGKTGWIVVDPLLSEESAAAGWKLFADTVEAKSGKRPIKAVIFSHSHSDHFGGVGGVVTPEQVEELGRASGRERGVQSVEI